MHHLMRINNLEQRITFFNELIQMERCINSEIITFNHEKYTYFLETEKHTINLNLQYISPTK